MSDGHCFISYSTADGVEFTRKITDELESGDPHILGWYDKRDLEAGKDWDQQIIDSIKTCKCLLFVMSEDSTKQGSNCKLELLYALRYKKPILPLLIYKDAEPSFLLGSRQWIDFTGEFKAGSAKLRKAIKRLDEPEGILDNLKFRLTDAEHALRRAKGDEEKRITDEIEELKAEIKRQEEIVRNPKAAQEQTQKNIETGLERERKPEKPIASSAQSTKFINPPPGIAPNYFQDRLVETKQAVDFINDDAQRLMTIVGRGGVGKTAMVCRLLKELESGQLPDGLGAMKVEGIVYLSESGSHRVTFANIFYDLCKLLPAEAANELDAIYKNPGGSTESKMCAVLEKFAGGRVVLLLDNFEPLVDSETFAIRDAELDEALRAFLNGTHTAVNIVITTRIAPKALNLIQPGRQRVLTLDEGLDSPYAENILREMDVDGRIGLQSASDALLGRARERTRGYPRALEALFAILASDRYTTLEELLAMPTPDNVVEALVGEAFNRLDVNAQKVMQALAVYNRPVAPAAVDYLLAPHLPAIDSAPILQRLANMHFARKESRRFYLHPVDREFAYNLLPEGSSDDAVIEKGGLKLFKHLWDLLDKYPDLLQNQDTFNQAVKNENANIVIGSVMAFQKLDSSLLKKMQQEGIFQDKKFLAELDKSFHIPPIWTRYALTNRAADYFAQARKPRAEWKKQEDLTAQLAEFDLRCAAGDYDTAASVLLEIDFDYLFLWGHYRLMIELHEKLQEKIIDEILRSNSIGNLGSAYYSIGYVPNAIKYYIKALEIDRENQYKQGEGTWLGNLGNCYARLGDVHKAIECYEQELIIVQELGNRNREGERLISLGNRYFELGDVQKAIEFHEQSLVILREFDKKNAISIAAENLGRDFLSIDEYTKAQENYQQAVEIADEISLPLEQNYARWGIAQANLFQNDLVNARAAIEAALQYDVPENNHNTSALHGIILLRMRDLTGFTESRSDGKGSDENLSGLGRDAFVRAIAQADEILAKTPEYYEALDAKGLALCGLALTKDLTGLTESRPDGKGSDGDLSGLVEQAIAAFRQARKIAPHAGIVKSVLRLFDELAQCDPHGLLKDVRAAAAGVATSAKSG